MNIQNNKGVILIPWMIILGLLVLGISTVVFYQYSSTNRLATNYIESVKTNVKSLKDDSQANIQNNKRITNSTFNKLGEQTFDDGTTNKFGTVSDINSTDDALVGLTETSLLDKTVTHRTAKIERLGEMEPNKSDNIFEIDLVDFLKTDGSYKGRIPAGELKLRYGRREYNTPPVYIVMGRVEKNTTIDLNRNYEVQLSRKKFGEQNQFGTSSQAIDQHSYNFIKIAEPGSCDSVSLGKDPTIGDPEFSWCKTVSLNDILGGTGGSEFDLSKYMYKVYLVFGFRDSNSSLTPFKIENPNTGTFGVGNFVQSDITSLTGENSKRRIFIKQSTKGAALPYMVYSLWVKGEIVLENDES